MNKIDRLISKVTNPSVHDLLEKNNPYMGKSYQELRDYMRPAARADEMPLPGTTEHDKYIYALLQARKHDRKQLIV